MAATTTALLSLLRAGDHMAPESLYASTLALLDDLLAPLGVKVTYIDATDANNYGTAIRPETKVLYLETAATPTLALIDIERVVAVARAHGLTTVLDNTLGGVIAPQTAWLTLRGIKTLALCMQRHNANAQQVAEFLGAHPKVWAVHYPGLPCDPQHELARRQMQGYGGMVAFDVGGVVEGQRLVNGLRLCSLAVSLGDVATVVQHSASMTHRSVPVEKRRAAGISDGLIRLSVGIESPDDIIADLEAALQLV